MEQNNRDSFLQSLFIGFLYMSAFFLAMVGLDNNKMSLNYIILAGSALIAAAILHAKERDSNREK